MLKAGLSISLWPPDRRAMHLWEGTPGPSRPRGIRLADKPYDTGAIRVETAQHGAFANVSPRIMRQRTFAFSPWLYRQRNQIESFFNRLEQLAGLAMRYDRRPDNFLAVLKLAATLIWINAL